MSETTQLTFEDRPLPPAEIPEVTLHEHPWKNETSLAAWESVRDCGWASAKAKQAYKLLYDHGAMTLLELEHMSARVDGRTPRGRSESTVIRRLSDLRDNGLARPTGFTKICSVTGKEAVTWMVTNALAPAEKFVFVRRCPHCGKEILKK